MEASKFTRLENALKISNPLFIEKLQPGLPEKRVRKLLDRSEVKGQVDCLVELYSWRNGMVPSREVAELEMGLFPKERFLLRDLNSGLMHFEYFRQASINKPMLTEAAGFYFPILWDEDHSWFAVDVRFSRNGRIIFIDTRSDVPCREAYATFDMFISDAIRANEMNVELNCFVKHDSGH